MILPCQLAGFDSMMGMSMEVEMAPQMTVCPSCSQHVYTRSEACPHCGGLIRKEGSTLLKTTSAALLGLALTACSSSPDPDDTGDTYAPQPDYGVADSGYYYPGDSGDQPEYGVPDTKHLSAESIPEADKKKP